MSPAMYVYGRMEQIGGRGSASYFTVLQQTDDLPLQPIVVGTYQDRFTKVNGSWQFSERRMMPDLFGQMQAHGKRSIYR